ncbi:MAG: hypothetical protein C0501_17810 [Isosphaera sp.]|nr:hypothetical protein [Isosphaera sp.]
MPAPPPRTMRFVLTRRVALCMIPPASPCRGHRLGPEPSAAGRRPRFTSSPTPRTAPAPEATVADERDLLRESARRILEADGELAARRDALRGLAAAPELRKTLEGVRDRVGALEGIGADSALALETIVNRVGRPVLEVAGDDYTVDGSEAAVWADRLGAAAVRAALRRVIPSVGRVEVDRHPGLTWVGTGWLIADGVVVTNRHVAEEFAARGPAGGFVFRRGWPDRDARMAARVDFRRELRDGNPRAFAVRDVLHIEDDDGPDFAFLRVEAAGPAGPLSPPLRPADGPAAARQYVATVGYPAADSRIPEQELMSRLFGDKYNVKRLAPGQVQRPAADLVLHDCTTLGGNSGSPIVDLATGGVVGLHFSGVFLRENRGVPIGYVTARLGRVLSPHRPTEATAPRVSASYVPPPQAAPAPVSVPADGTAVTITVPLQIRVTLGTPADVGAPPGRVDEALAAARGRLAGRADVLAVRDGFAFRDGWITPDPAVVVVADRAAAPEDLGLPARLHGFPVEVRAAGPWDLAAGRPDALEGLPRTTYRKPTEFELKEVHERMTVTAHVSPDAGWPTLCEFLRKTRAGLTVGMYDFTAQHIAAEVLAAVRDDPRKLSLVLQGEGDEAEVVAELRRALGARFDHAPASVGRDRQFASAYHIKVAVRDGKAVWLSSGNWQPANQPARTPAAGDTSWGPLRRNNREWHVVVENAKLAKQFEKFLLYDLRNAKADARPEAPPPAPAFLVDDPAEERPPAGVPTWFAPLTVTREVRVMPLLTPDNYHEHALALVRSAERRVLFQNQSLNLLGPGPGGEDRNEPRFAALVDALVAKQRDGVDVRVIIRGEFDPVGPLEQLQRRGFDMRAVRLQDRCHTKGIVVDGARVLVGSHNWTNQGTLVNRDASLVFEDEEIARYFEGVFYFDWKHLARQAVGGRPPRPVRPGEEAPAGTRLATWDEVVNGD